MGIQGAGNEKNDRSDQADKTARVAVKSADKAAGKNADKATDKDADNSGDADNKADKADADANKLDSVSKLAGHRIGVVTGNAATLKSWTSCSATMAFRSIRCRSR